MSLDVKQQESHEGNARGGLLTYALPFVLGMVVVIWLAFNLNPHVHGRDFMQNGWLPAKLILAGDNPYHPNQQLVHQLSDPYLLPVDDGDTEFNAGDKYNAIYPFWAMLLQVPLGWLDFPTALIVWTVLSGAALLAGVLVALVAARKQLGLQFSNGAWLAVCIAGVVVSLCFMPSLLHFFLGQYSAIILLVLAMLFLPNTSALLSGFAFAVATMKPQISVLVLGLAMLGWLRVARTKLWVALGLSALLYFAPMLFFPYAVSDWFSVNFLVQKQASSQAPVSSSWWGVSYHWGHWLGEAWWLMAVVLCLLTLLLLYRPLRQVLKDGDWQQAMPLTIIVMLLITPYTIAYDQILLFIPAAWLWMRLQAADNRLALLVRIALLLWVTLLPLLLLLALDVAQSNYIKFLQTLSLLGLYYLSEYAVAIDEEEEMEEISA